MKITNRRAPTIVSLLRKAPSLKCLNAYPTAEAALDGVPARKPDVLLVDIRLPGMSGIQCVAQAEIKNPRSACADAHDL